MTPIEEQAFARNDRYLREFVEAFDLCPFARTCRESGALERRIIAGTMLQAEVVLATIAEMTGSQFHHVEVALLIFPESTATFVEFDRFAAALRGAHSDTGNGFFIVPFHPEAPEDTGSPERLVPFLRRTPDPTLQLVRVSVLEAVRGPHSGDTVWMDPATLGDTLPPPVLSVSERIARRDYETVRRVGVERLRALLADIRGTRQNAEPDGG